MNNNSKSTSNNIPQTAATASPTSAATNNTNNPSSSKTWSDIAKKNTSVTSSPTSPAVNTPPLTPTGSITPTSIQPTTPTYSSAATQGATQASNATSSNTGAVNGKAATSNSHKKSDSYTTNGSAAFGPPSKESTPLATPVPSTSKPSVGHHNSTTTVAGGKSGSAKSNPSAHSKQNSSAGGAGIQFGSIQQLTQQQQQQSVPLPTSSTPASTSGGTQSSPSGTATQTNLGSLPPSNTAEDTTSQTPQSTNPSRVPGPHRPVDMSRNFQSQQHNQPNQFAAATGSIQQQQHQRKDSSHSSHSNSSNEGVPPPQNPHGPSQYGGGGHYQQHGSHHRSGPSQKYPPSNASGYSPQMQGMPTTGAPMAHKHNVPYQQAPKNSNMTSHSPHLASAPSPIPASQPMTMQMPVTQQNWSPQMGQHQQNYYVPYDYYLQPQQMFIPPFQQQYTQRPMNNMPPTPPQPRLSSSSSYLAPPKNKAIKIVNPETLAVVNPVNPDPISSTSTTIPKKDVPVPTVIKMEDPNDKKDREGVSVRAAPSSPNTANRAIKIVDPAVKEKEERERKEKEDAARKAKEEAELRERQEKERLGREEAERKAEIERKEREDRERKEREERERIEREERERKEREENERRAREEKERLEREEEERKIREEKEREEREREKERKELEERERKEREAELARQQEIEKREREERERQEEERLEKEREEKARLEWERMEKERIEQEEKERIEQEEKERIEQEEKERIEQEEKERIEQEEKEKLEKEEVDKKRKAEEEAAAVAATAAAAAIAAAVATSKVATEFDLSNNLEKSLESSKGPESVDTEKREKPGRPGPPGRLDFTQINNNSHALPPSARSLMTPLKTPRTPGTPTRKLENLTTVEYPEGISTPNPANAEEGKHKYDRAFLMQFAQICIERPDGLPPLDETMDIKDENRRGSSSGGMGSRKPSARGNQRPPVTPGGNYGDPMGTMGVFRPPTQPPKTSDERFRASTVAAQQQPMGNYMGNRPIIPRTPSAGPLPPYGLTQRENSQQGRTRSNRGGRGGGGGNRQNTRDAPPSQGGPTIPMDQVVPLKTSENAWKPTIGAVITPVIPADGVELIPIDVVIRKVKSLLNKLTLEMFDAISDQIILFTNQSIHESDGQTLRTVIQLVFEKATDEANWSTMYAQLARKMLDKVSTEIEDDGVVDQTGNHIKGGSLFRKYLLNRCQDEFEKGWKVDVPKADGEVELYSEEYYTAMAAKRKGLGLIRFIGELFKLQMLTERIMHECIKKLLSNVNDPEEEETESLCNLMRTVGKDLDHKKAKGWMDIYFDRMKELSENKKLSSRIRFMIEEVIDLRKKHWVPRRDNNAPKKLQEIKDDLVKAAEQEKEMMKRTASSGGRMPNMNQQFSRGGSQRGKDQRGSNNGLPPTADGWNTVTKDSRKTGDLAQFGKMDRSKSNRSLNFAPNNTNVFTSLKAKSGSDSKKDEKLTATIPIGSSNIYNMLEQHTPDNDKRELSTPTERPKLMLLPRGATTPYAESPPTLDSSVESPMDMTPVTRKDPKEEIDNTLQEFWSVKNITELIYCIKKLDAEFHGEFITALINSAVEKKQSNVNLICDTIKQLYSEDVVPKETIKKSCRDFMDIVDDLSVDVPQVFKYGGQILVAARIEPRELQALLEPLIDVGGASASQLTAEYLKALRNSEGEETAVSKFKESGFDLKVVVFTDNQRIDEEIKNFLEKQDLIEFM